MYNILVTGVGAVIGYGIIRSLRESSYDLRIVGTDIYNDAVGKYWCDDFVQGIRADDRDYPNFLYELITKKKIDLVIPGIEQDINRIVKEQEKFKKLGVKFAINNPELINIANDKWKTHLKLEEYNIPRIKSFIDGNYDELEKELGSPMLLKPRRSYASKGIQEIVDESDYNYWKKKLQDNFMVQEIVGDSDSEFTIGVFGLGNGKSSQKITLKRKLGPDGATSKAKVINNHELNNVVDRLVSIFKPMGPTNFQFRYHDGNFLLLEINPRISSSTSIRTAFGFNEAEMCIEYFLEGKIPSEREIKKGSVVRYLKDLVTYDSDYI